MYRKGQFLTLDAFIALVVIAAGLVLVLTLHSYSPSLQTPALFSQDFVNTLSQAKIREVNNAYVMQQIRAGNITNTDNTLLQQVAELYYYDMESIASEMLVSVTSGIIPAQYNYDILLDGTTLASRGAGQADAELLVSTKRIVFGVVNRTVEFWGPSVVEVRLWQ
jgi:multisubunit Na+/H+ antiporter MnhB subunit